jgi:nicotinamidase-related amidase
VRTSDYGSGTRLDEKTGEWLDEVRRSVAPRPHLRLRPGRCALLVIDMVRYFTDPGGRCFLPAGAAVAPRIASLLEAWRANGWTVVFTRHGHEGAEDLGMLGRFFSDYIRAGEPDSEIIDPLAPARGETVLRKTTYDAFLGTRLEEILRERGAEQVLVTGVLTHMCVETTSRSAFCRGFEVYVPADGTASSTEERHLQSLKAMADALAVVTSTTEVLEECEATR